MSLIARLVFLIVPLIAGNAHAADEADSGLVDMAGNTASLDLHTGNGKWLVVMVWSVTCGICSREVPVYSDFHDEHKNQGIKVLGVALDGYEQKETIKETMQRWDMRFPTLIGDLGMFAFNYQLNTGEQLMGTPTFMVYTPSGKLVANNPGPMRTSALLDYIAKHRVRN